jgi:TatD DNase family protein
LVPSINRESASRTIALAESHPTVFAAVGFHPTELEGVRDAALHDVQQLAFHPKVVAIGEIGLDYYWIKGSSGRSRQREALQAQLEIAAQVSRPVILHMREEFDAETGSCGTDLMEILEEWVRELRVGGAELAGQPGVLHSFAGSQDMALRAIGMGFKIGITGPITYKNADTRRQVIGGLPLDTLLIETDAPFLAPAPKRGQRNEPALVTIIADKIAELQSCAPDEVAAVTSASAEQLFAWGGSS